MWEFSEFLPPVKGENIVTLGEGWTPYVVAPNHAKRVGLKEVWCKIEGCNPTGSFKDRAASLGVSLALEWGKKGVFTASDGNAAAAISAYCARARLKCLVMIKEDTPASKLAQISMYSPILVRVVGLYESLGGLEASLAQVGRILPGWSNLFIWAPFNPFTVDAFKTIAYEIAIGGRVPDVLFVPVAGGDLLYGLYKGFSDLRSMGRLERIPRLVAVQGEGADPTVQAIEQGLDMVRETGPPRTVASALSVNFGAEHSIKAARETGGFGISVPDDQIMKAQKEIAQNEGIFCEISSAVSVAAIRKAVGEGRVASDERVAAILTGSGLKHDYPVSEHVSKVPLAGSPSELSRVLGELLRA